MENPEFVKEYESIQPEMDVIRAITEARTSQNEFVPKQKA